jgi:hypothetical protein
MTKTRLLTLRAVPSQVKPPTGRGMFQRLGAAIAGAWRVLSAAVRRVMQSIERGAPPRMMTIEGHYGNRVVSMRLDRHDVRHYARLARAHGLEPSLGGYLDFRLRTADLPLPSPLERTVAGFMRDSAGTRADQFLFADPDRAERDFLQLLEP